ncbi:CoA transferase [Microbacterium sp. NPDC019599]|uniref:CoA transferase n=1 Tax=Microbacterium sp. NPDC019599 TaxID=3154690 RepID=UPI0034010FB9
MTTTRAHAILAELGIQPTARLVEARHPVPLASRLAVDELAWSAVAAASLAAADLAGAGSVALDPARIALAYASERYGSIDGERPVAFAPLSGFFRAADGWVRTHGNYPHHARALLAGLQLPEGSGADAVATALANLPADAAAQAIASRGGICAAVLAEQPPVDHALRLQPLVRVTRLGDASTRALDGRRSTPLAAVRVLDLTRVIAGPVSTRTLALFGAEVLRIDPPRMPEIAWQHLDTGHGKRSAVLELDDPAGRGVLEGLLTSADVVVLGYRPEGLARLGLSPRELAQRHPGLVVAQLSAWGEPDRRGFDSIVQAACGIAWIETRDGVTPGALPAQALDHSAGYLLAAAVIAALRRRAQEGGSWLVETSLRRVAAELLGMPRTAEPADHEAVEPGAHTQTFEVDGRLVTTVGPAPSFEGGPTAFRPPRPWGEDEPAWPTDQR